jgi:dTMP kinase
MTVNRRGLLIAFEGCDRSGKSTICTRLAKTLNAEHFCFPGRLTPVGKMLDSYLRGTQNLDDHAVHLLFSANRWEKASDILRAVAEGKHVVVDRYAFSGVAFSAAKEGMDMEWCKQPDRGLPKPDLVCFLDVSPEVAKTRGGFGEERYEVADFQKRVRCNYNRLMDDSWTQIDTSHLTLDEVFDQVQKLIVAKLAVSDLDPVHQLWTDQKANEHINGNH